MASKHTVEMFYDVISPYAWFGFATILRYEARWNLDLRLRPFSAQGMLKTTGNWPPPITTPVKGKYMHHDMKRNIPRFGVPMKLPTEFFFEFLSKGSLLPMRFLSVLNQEIGKNGLTRQHLIDTSLNLWMRGMSENLHISNPEAVATAARKAGLADEVIKKFLEASASQAAKDLLKATTDEAVESGAFGTPWYRVKNGKTGEIDVFFGSDRFDAMADFIGQKYHGPQPGKA